jgi:hypothetical protein
LTTIQSQTGAVTLGRDAIRFVVGGLRMVIPRHKIVKFERMNDLAHLFYVDTDGSVKHCEFADASEVQQVEDWLLDGMPGVTVTNVLATQAVEGPKPTAAEEIGPGSIVEYLGQVYEVSREAHDGDVRRWRLAGHLSRGVNESALRLVTPFRKGDKVILALRVDEVEQVPGATGVIEAGHQGLDGRSFQVRLDDLGYIIVHDSDILHASRDLPDGTVAVLR